MRSLSLPKSGLPHQGQEAADARDEGQAARRLIDPDQRPDLESQGDQQRRDQHQGDAHVGQRVRGDETPPHAGGLPGSYRELGGSRMKLSPGLPGRCRQPLGGRVPPCVRSERTFRKVACGSRPSHRWTVVDASQESGMSTPLLETKLFLPRPRRGLVPRPRLRDRLHQGLALKLMLVSAPAGFGKTTLLVDWVAAVSAPDVETSHCLAGAGRRATTTRPRSGPTWSPRFVPWRRTSASARSACCRNRSRRPSRPCSPRCSTISEAWPARWCCCSTTTTSSTRPTFTRAWRSCSTTSRPGCTW